MTTELCYLPAFQQAQLIQSRQISCQELLSAHLTQIEKTNPQVNAIVTLLPEQAMVQAKTMDEQLGRGENAGILAGLPIAHKDLAATKGIRTTMGSPIFADQIPDENSLFVDRLQQAGAITIGKTNTPEFGAGSHTFNAVFGATRNPFDPSKSAGGSSGGAAVALACGMIPLADGSDMGGSLRNPASFNNVVGFRPSPGRVPSVPSQTGWFTLAVSGPMARTVQDVALMLSVMAGPDYRSPIALPEAGHTFRQPLKRDFKGIKVAWSRNLGDLPVDPSVTAVLEKQRATFEALGCELVDIEPDFSGADESFKAWRAWAFAQQLAPLLAEHRHQMKDTVIWNVEMGLAQTGQMLAEAEAKRTALFQRMAAFMQEFEFLVCPVSQVPPFDIEQEYVKEINGVAMETYIDWMKSCYYVSAVGMPAISVPAGFTDDGLPIGIQIMGRHQADFSVLQMGHAFEQATNFWQDYSLF